MEGEEVPGDDDEAGLIGGDGRGGRARVGDDETGAKGKEPNDGLDSCVGRCSGMGVV